MDFYKSPSVQIFETASSAVEPLSAGQGVLVVGFSTRGPINELMHFRSYEQFEKMMGGPVADFPLAHLLARRIFNTGAGTLYFVRAGSESDNYGAEKSAVKVVNAENPNFGEYFYETGYWDAGETNPIENEDFLVFKNGYTEDSIVIKIDFDGGGEIVSAEETFKITLEKSFIQNPLRVIPLDTIVARFNNNSTFSSRAVMKKEKDGVQGIYVKTKNYIEEVTFNFSNKSGTSVEANIAFVGVSEINAPSPGAPNNYQFVIEAKYPGSGMNGVSVRKTARKQSFLTDEEYFDVSIVDSKGVQLELFTNLTLKNFIQRINDNDYGSNFVYIDTSDSEGEDPVFVDGTYILGEGTLLPGNIIHFTEDAKVGKDGVPSQADEPYSYNEVIANLLISALSEPSLLNMDNVFYSIIATPDSQNSSVQDTAIELATKRGDSFYIADIPLELSIDKASIPLAINWHNGTGSDLRGTPFDSSYVGVYYGWTTVLNEYTGSNIYIPPSVLVVPRMLQTDASDGVYNPPAGARRGRVIAYDYLYSPDTEDREEMMGGDNCINPIIYSNTRGLMIFGQKTADRSGSPLNRINIRRMVNRIKTRLFTSLDVIRFELNNSATRERARSIANNILSEFRSAGALEGFSVNVQSPGGAERDVVNIYIDMVPVGLVERIRIYINITEGGVATVEG